EIFTSLKAAIDRRRTAGRFILTGSANVLLVSKLADSLAGRMGILRLHPLAQCELLGKRSRFIEALFRGGFRTRITDRLGPALAAPFQMTRQTIHDYVTVLERIFLLDRLPPWYSNRLSRLVKATKLHMGDTGLACALLGIDAVALHRDRDRLGPLLETFVLQE